MSEHFSWPEGTDYGDATAGSLFVSGDNGILLGTDQLWQRQSMKEPTESTTVYTGDFLENDRQLSRSHFTPKSDKKST